MKFISAHMVEYVPDKWLSYDDVLLYPQFSDMESRNDARIDLSSKFTSHLNLKIPILSAPMDTVTEKDMVIELSKNGAYGILHRFYKDKTQHLKDIEDIITITGGVAISIGANKDDVNFVQEVIDIGHNKPIIVAIDVAHGHLNKSITQIRRLRERYGSKIQIISGSICTPIAVQDSIKAGVDAIRVGVGCGGMCSTRLVTGHGIPQLTAIMQCRQAINGMQSNVALIADGGIRNSGDIIKALAAGADSVMLGQLLAATSESPGDLYINSKESQVFSNPPMDWIPVPSVLDSTSTKKYKKYRGQSSQDFLNELGKTGVAPEGEHTYILYKGSVEPIIKELVGGIRSGMTYAGCNNLTELSEKSLFLEITTNGYIESTPHGKS